MGPFSGGLDFLQGEICAVLGKMDLYDECDAVGRVVPLSVSIVGLFVRRLCF